MIKCTRHFIIQFAGFFLKPPQSSLFFAVNVKNIIPRLSDYGISKAPFPVLSDYRKSKESFPALSEDGMSKNIVPRFVEKRNIKHLSPFSRITESQKYHSSLYRKMEYQEYHLQCVGLRDVIHRKYPISPKSVIPSVSGREMSLISYFLSLFQVVTLN